MAAKDKNVVSQQLKMDYNEVFNSEAGKRVLEDLMTACHVLEPEPDNIPENVVARAHRRDVVHHIMFRMGHGAAHFLKLIEEIENAN